MVETLPRIAGSGGKPKGGGVEAPNTLQSTATAKIIDVVSEGEIVGLVDGVRSIYFDNTPIQNADGSYNFRGVSVTEVIGLPDQTHVPAFTDAQSVIPGPGQVTQAAPGPGSRTVTISDPNVDAVKVIVRVPRLTKTDLKSGDTNGSSVQLALDTAPVGQGFTFYAESTISGKTTAGYQRSYFVNRPAGATGAWQIRMRRLTVDQLIGSITFRQRSNDPPDSPQVGDSWYQTDKENTFRWDGIQWVQIGGKTLVFDDLIWESYIEVVNGKFSYPDTAYIALAVNAAQFGAAIPNRSYEIKGLKIQVPTNYNPVTRAYTGLWDGTFKREWSDNPAWVLYDLLTNPRYGLGEYIEAAQVDKGNLYQIARYCDELVPSGFKDALGNVIMEPRFTFNGAISGREEAYKVVQAVAAVFRGMTFWASGMVGAIADMPQDIAKIVTPANVVGGVINYSGTALKARHTVAMVTWVDPTDSYRPAIEVVEGDPDVVNRFGWRPLEVTAFGCQSRGQARRFGKWMLDSEKHETDVATYIASFDHADVLPGEIIAIADPAYANVRFGGRAVAVTETSLTIDAPIEILVGETTYVSVTLPDGDIAERQLTNAPGATSVLTWSALSPLPDLPVPGAMWAVSATSLQPRQFRVIGVREVEGKQNQFEITAVQHDPQKFDRVELGLSLDPIPYSRYAEEAGQVSAVAFAVEASRTEGGTERALRISWTEPTLGQIAKYRLLWRHEAGEWSSPIEVYQPEATIEDIRDGKYDVQIVAYSLFGKPGGAVFASYQYGASGVNDLPPPSGVQAVDGSWQGSDLVVSWRAVEISGTGVETGDFQVEVRSGASLLRTEYVDEPIYRYTFEKNVQDGGPRRSISLTIAQRDRNNRLGAAAAQTFLNPSPSHVAPALRNTSGFAALDWAASSFPADFSHILVWDSLAPSIILDIATAKIVRGTSYILPQPPGTTVYYRWAFVDVFGWDNTAAPETAVVVSLIDTAALAEEIIGEDNLTAGLRERIDLVDTPGSGLLDRLNLVQTVTLPDLSALTSLAHSRITQAAAAFSDGVLNAVLTAQRAEASILDAGFYVEPGTGLVKLFALEQYKTATNATINSLSVTLDAQAAEIALRATTTYVDQQIALAAIDPSQLADLTGVQVQVNDLSVRLLAAEGAIVNRALTIDLNNAVGRITTAETNISSLTGQISSKVETATFTGLEARVTVAEQDIAAIGDVATIRSTLYATRQASQQAREAGTAALSALLAGQQVRELATTEIAFARQELQTEITATGVALATARLELGSQIAANQAALLVEQQTRADAISAEASARQTLAARVTAIEGGNVAGFSLASFDSRITTNANNVAAQASSITSLQSQVTAVQGSVNTKAQTFAQTSAPASANNGDVWFDTDDNNRLYRREGGVWVARPDLRVANLESGLATANSAIATNASSLSAQALSISSLSARVLTIEGGTIGSFSLASIQSTANAAASQSSANASAITTLTTTVSGNTASIQSQATSINGLLATYTLRVQTVLGDGTVVAAGFGLSSGAGAPARVAFLADVFTISLNGTPTPVFTVGTHPVTGNPAVVMNGAAYVGTLTANQITTGTLGAGVIYAGSLSANQITTGTLNANLISVGTLQADRLVLNGIPTDRIAPNAVSELYAATAGDVTQSAPGGTPVWTTAVSVAVGAGGTYAIIATGAAELPVSADATGEFSVRITVNGEAVRTIAPMMRFQNLTTGSVTQTQSIALSAVASASAGAVIALQFLANGGSRARFPGIQATLLKR